MEHDIAALYNQYYSYLYKYALSLTGDPLWAEELVAETFYRVILKFHTYRGASRIETWMAGILKNLYYSDLRRQKKLTRLKEAMPQQAPEDTGDRLLAEQIYQALDSLEDPYHRVFTMRVLENRKDAEIAEELGRTENWVRVTFFRAKQKIRSSMEESI